MISVEIIILASACLFETVAVRVLYILITSLILFSFYLILGVSHNKCRSYADLEIWCFLLYGEDWLN